MDLPLKHWQKSLCLTTLFLLLFLIACDSSPKKEEAGSAQPLRMNISRSNATSLFYIAEDQGYFQEQGLNITAKEFQSGKAGIQGLLAGEADIATATEFAFVSHVGNHQDLRILAAISTFKNKHFISRLDSGITKPEQFSGKKIGLTRKTAVEYFLGTFLAAHTIDKDSVQIVDLKPRKVVEALVTGGIDIALLWEPHAHDLKKLLENNVISWLAQGDQDNYFLLITTAAWLENHEKEAEQLLRALYKAEKHASTDEAILETFLLDKFLYERSYVDSVIPNMQLDLSLPEELIEVMTKQAQWRVDAGIANTESLVNLREYVHPAALEKVNSRAISMK